MFDRLIKWISDSITKWLTYDHPYEGIPLCDFERIRYELRPCDVLLIEGRSRVSEVIRSITQSSWSHAALYIGRLHDIQDAKIRNLVSAHFKGSPDTQLLIEGIPGKGGMVSDIMSYKSDHIRLCRPRGLSRQDAQQVIAYAVRKLGHDYDFRHLMDLGRFLLPWTLFPRRYRSKLFEYHPGDSTKTICSTLIAEAFHHVEFPILPLVKKHATKGIELITRNPKLYTPRDFDYSPYFEIIKYPFVEFADYAMYRQLPWNRAGLVSHDKFGVQNGSNLQINTDKKRAEKTSAEKKINETDDLNTSDENKINPKVQMITDPKLNTIHPETMIPEKTNEPKEKMSGKEKLRSFSIPDAKSMKKIMNKFRHKPEIKSSDTEPDPRQNPPLDTNSNLNTEIPPDRDPEHIDPDNNTTKDSNNMSNMPSDIFTNNPSDTDPNTSSKTNFV